MPRLNPEQRFMKFHVWIIIKKYVGESSRSLYKQIYKHTRNLKKETKISLIKHNSETNHNFFKDSKILVYIHNKNTGKLLNLIF